MIVGEHGIQTHQPAHGTAADKGMFPAGKSGEMAVDVGLENLGEPSQCQIPFAFEFTENRIRKVVGGIFPETVIIGTVVTFYSSYD